MVHQLPGLLDVRVLVRDHVHEAVFDIGIHPFGRAQRLETDLQAGHRTAHADGLAATPEHAPITVVGFVRTLVALAANAVGLIVAAALLDDMRLDATGFITALIVFTIVFALMLPFLASQLRRGGTSVGSERGLQRR